MLNYNTLEEIKQFNTVSEACIYIGKTNQFVSTITSCCRGKRNSAFGYKWKFNNENITK